VILPVYADRVLGGAFALGLLIGAFGVGAVLGAAMYGMFGNRLPRRTVFVIAFLIAGSPRYFLLAAEPALALLVAAHFLTGIVAGAINPVLMVVRYERVPEHMRGRVLGLSRAVVWGAMPLGALVAGYVVGWLGLSSTLIVIGGVYLLVTVVSALAPVWREMDLARPGDLSVPAEGG
jgi:MFS family permease